MELAQAVVHDKEVHEQPEERLHVDEVHDRDLVRHAGARARHHEVALRVHQQELDHLDRGQVRLPPDFARVRAHKVVHVHDRVHAAVEHDGHVEVTVVGRAEVGPVALEQQKTCVPVSSRDTIGLRAPSTCTVRRAEQKRTYEEDGDVVVDVEHRELLPLLAHDDEEGVAEVQHFGQIEDVHEVAHDWVLVVKGVAGGGRPLGTYRAHHHEGEVADAEREDRAEVGQEVVLHGRLAVAQRGVDPVHEHDVHAVGPLLVALEECAGHRAAAAGLRGGEIRAADRVVGTKEEVTRSAEGGGHRCKGPA
ncbi:unnamed protein product [Phytophthora lilii]|uniref:Unnamed protein product n=1 Tax=Phytophthora lilii TaxID=2077276 RepID=A0A9W6WR51_9STRA|nr:unnamed protein product [Phytophthora lilii]